MTNKGTDFQMQVNNSIASQQNYNEKLCFVTATSVVLNLIALPQNKKILSKLNKYVQILLHKLIVQVRFLERSKLSVPECFTFAQFPQC